LDKQSNTPRSKRLPTIISIGIALLVISLVTWVSQKKSFTAKQAKTVLIPVATTNNIESPHIETEPTKAEKHGTVNTIDGTIDALVEGIITDAPTPGVYHIDLGEATVRPPPRVGCIGRYFLKNKTFVKGSCNLLSASEQIRFRYIPGPTILVVVPATKASEESPDYVDLWKCSLPVMLDQVGMGRQDKQNKLGPSWSELRYRVESGSLQESQWTVVDTESGERLTLKCGSLVVARKSLSPLLIPGFCPDLQGDSPDPGALIVYARRLTTDDHMFYYFGVESDKEAAERSFVMYLKVSN
jgi:hypothetical protein